MRKLAVRRVGAETVTSWRVYQSVSEWLSNSEPKELLQMRMVACLR